MYCHSNIFGLICFSGAAGEKDKTPVSHETFLLMANSQNDVDDWVKAIRRVIWAPLGGGKYLEKIVLVIKNREARVTCLPDHSQLVFITVPRGSAGFCFFFIIIFFFNNKPTSQGQIKSFFFFKKKYIFTFQLCKKNKQQRCCATLQPTRI